MFDEAFIGLVFSWLKALDIEVAPGLSEAEIAAIEERDRFRFPPDLSMLLQAGLPLANGRYGFPDWRNPDISPVATIREQLLHGILFDVQNNVVWSPEWGSKPDDSEQAQAVATRCFNNAPIMIPIVGHRLIPAKPEESGNPVFSIVQTDSIVYGVDLERYFLYAFKPPAPSQSWWPRERPQTEVIPRWIDYWSDLTRLNDSWPDEWLPSDWRS